MAMRFGIKKLANRISHHKLMNRSRNRTFTISLEFRQRYAQATQNISIGFIFEAESRDYFLS